MRHLQKTVDVRSRAASNRPLLMTPLPPVKSLWLETHRGPHSTGDGPRWKSGDAAHAAPGSLPIVLLRREANASPDRQETSGAAGGADAHELPFDEDAAGACGQLEGRAHAAAEADLRFRGGAPT